MGPRAEKECTEKRAILSHEIGNMSEEWLPQLVRIPAGECLMGSDEGDEDERPVHRVYLDEFYIGARQVTNSEYERFVREAGHRVPALREFPAVVTDERRAMFRDLALPYVWPDGKAPPQRHNHPVTLVQYEDALAYCRWLGARTERPFRLPTEAEWEKAARGGFEGRRYPWGNDIDASRANFLPDPSLKPKHGTQAVGSYPPNGYDLYDMAGNVWEWVSDWYRADYYDLGEYRNPRGPDTGALRMVGAVPGSTTM
jgi:sulfatase modifying factor 1